MMIGSVRVSVAAPSRWQTAMPDVPGNIQSRKNEIRLLLLDRQHGFVAIRRDRNVEALAAEVAGEAPRPARPRLRR